MSKYHISKSGKPAKCIATIRDCPCGGESEHYNSIEEAQKACDEKNKKEHSVLANNKQISIPNWIAENTENNYSWGFYDGKIEHKPIDKINTNHYVDDLMGKHKPQFIECDFNKIYANGHYNSSNTGYALLNIEDNKVLVSFPVNKTNYLVESFKKELNTENVKVVKSGYVDRDTALKQAKIDYYNDPITGGFKEGTLDSKYWDFGRDNILAYGGGNIRNGDDIKVRVTVGHREYCHFTKNPKKVAEEIRTEILSELQIDPYLEKFNIYSYLDTKGFEDKKYNREYDIQIAEGRKRVINSK